MSTLMIRACKAQRGDVTYYGATVQSREPNGPDSVVLYARTAGGALLREMWDNDDDITAVVLALPATRLTPASPTGDTT